MGSVDTRNSALQAIPGQLEDMFWSAPLGVDSFSEMV